MRVGSLTKWAVPGQRGLTLHGTEARPSIDCIPVSAGPIPVECLSPNMDLHRECAGFFLF